MSKAVLELYADLRTAGIKIDLAEGELRLTPTLEPSLDLLQRVEKLKGELAMFLGTSAGESQGIHTEPETVRRVVDSGRVIGAIQLRPDEELWVTTSEFKRKSYLNIRLFVRRNGQYLPTRKGITMPLDLSPEIRELLQKAELELETTS